MDSRMVLYAMAVSTIGKPPHEKGEQHDDRRAEHCGQETLGHDHQQAGARSAAKPREETDGPPYPTSAMAGADHHAQPRADDGGAREHRRQGRLVLESLARLTGAERGG